MDALERIGVRELRQHASRWLARVEDGASFEVTSRGRPVALLVPIDHGAGPLDRLERTGRLRRGSGGLLDDEPAPPTDGQRLSDALAELRADER